MEVAAASSHPGGQHHQKAKRQQACFEPVSGTDPFRPSAPQIDQKPQLLPAHPERDPLANPAPPLSPAVPPRPARQGHQRRPQQVKLLLQGQRPGVVESEMEFGGIPPQVTMDVLRVGEVINPPLERRPPLSGNPGGQGDQHHEAEVIDRPDPQAPARVKRPQEPGRALVPEDDRGDQIPREHEEQVHPGPAEEELRRVQVEQQDHPGRQGPQGVQLGHSARQRQAPSPESVRLPRPSSRARAPGPTPPCSRPRTPRGGGRPGRRRGPLSTRRPGAGPRRSR